MAHDNQQRFLPEIHKNSVVEAVRHQSMRPNPTPDQLHTEKLNNTFCFTLAFCFFFVEIVSTLDLIYFFLLFFIFP